MQQQSAPRTHNSLSLPLVGKRDLGRYTLLVKLATGGMAEIFLARQRGAQGFEKLVVVKRILASFVADPDFVGMFLDEGRLAGQLSHPNIVQTFDLGEDEGNYFIAMEYVAGESLAALARAARLKGRSLDDRFCARFISQAAAALDHAHRQTDVLGKPLNIVHRDISPQNILVTYEGQIKVVDFGIAKAANRASQTGQGQIKGKLSYMSPEQMSGTEVVDGRADVFGLGVVLFELVTGSRLVEGGDAALAVALIGGTRPMPLASERRPDIDPRLDRIIAKAMSRSPGERYLTGGELHVDLESWLSGRGPLNPSEIGEFIQDLFAERIADRKAIIEKALQGEFEARGEFAVADAKSDPSMPDASLQTRSPLYRFWRTKRSAVVGVGVALLVGVVFLARHPSSGAPAPVTPVTEAAPGPKPVEVAPVQRAPQPAVAPTPVAAPVAAPITAPVAPTRPAAPVAVAAPKAVAETPRPVKLRPGKLSIDSTPWTEVFWKGRSLGQTPLIEVSLPPGTQRLVLKNADEKIEQTIEVAIRSGEVTAKRLKLK